jgi:hypothetical protein
MNAGTASACKPIHDATDNTPECLKAIGVRPDEWCFAVKAHLQTLARNGLSGEADRVASQLELDVLDYCQKKQNQWRGEGIQGPRNDALLSMFEEEVKRDDRTKIRWTSTKEQGDADDKLWKKTGKFLPTTPTILARRLGYRKETGRQQVNRALAELDHVGLSSRTGGGIKGQIRIWVHAKPNSQKSKMRNKGASDAFSSPSSVPAEVNDGIVALNELARKRIFPVAEYVQNTVAQLHLEWDPRLSGDAQYCEAAQPVLVELSAALKADFAAALENRKFEANERLAAIAAGIGRTEGVRSAGVDKETKGDRGARDDEKPGIVNGRAGTLNKEEEVLSIKQGSSSSVEQSGKPRVLHTERQNHVDDHRFLRKAGTHLTGDQTCAPKNGDRSVPESQGEQAPSDTLLEDQTQNPPVETPSHHPIAEDSTAVAASSPDGTEVQWASEFLERARAKLRDLATLDTMGQPHPELFPMPDRQITADILQPWRGREIGFFDWLAYAAERGLGRKRKGIGYALFLKDSIVCAKQWAPDRLLSKEFRFRDTWAHIEAAGQKKRDAKERESGCDRCKANRLVGMVGSALEGTLEFCSCALGRENAAARGPEFIANEIAAAKNASLESKLILALTEHKWPRTATAMQRAIVTAGPMGIQIRICQEDVDVAKNWQRMLEKMLAYIGDARSAQVCCVCRTGSSAADASKLAALAAEHGVVIFADASQAAAGASA